MKGNSVAHLTVEKPGQQVFREPNMCPIGGGAWTLSPDWLPGFYVNWEWGRYIPGEDVNPHVKGSLGTG